MSLIKCHECGKEVSSYAKACPNCGFPIEEYQEQMCGFKGINNGQEVSSLGKKNKAESKNNILTVLLFDFSKVREYNFPFSIIVNGKSYKINYADTCGVGYNRICVEKPDKLIGVKVISDRATDLDSNNVEDAISFNAGGWHIINVNMPEKTIHITDSETMKDERVRITVMKLSRKPYSRNPD